MKRLLIVLALVVISFSHTNAATTPPLVFELINLPITIRVDTTDADVRQVYDLFRSFLSSRPDSLYDSPYWNEKEKKKYPEPYSARRWVYQKGEILGAFPPLLLSIEKEGEYYCIRTLYYREGLEEPYKGSNPWALQRMYAKKVKVKTDKDSAGALADIETDQIGISIDTAGGRVEKEEDVKEFRLFDPLRIVTKNWRYRKVGPIAYYFPHYFSFDRSTSLRMTQFIRWVRREYDLEKVDPIEFYITENVDDMAAAVGLDYSLGPSVGRSHAPNGQIFSSLGSEWYPHEMTHVLFRDYRPHFILMEGIATYLGGTMNRPFESLMLELAAFFAHNDTITLQNILDSPYLEGSTKVYYASGALLCKMAHDRGGAEAVKALLEAGLTHDELFEKIEGVLGIKREDVTNVLRQNVRKYTGK